MKKIQRVLMFLTAMSWHAYGAEMATVYEVKPHTKVSVIFPEECWNEVTEEQTATSMNFPRFGSSVEVPKVNLKRRCMRFQKFIDIPDGYIVTIEYVHPSGERERQRIHLYDRLKPGQKLVIDVK